MKQMILAVAFGMVGLTAGASTPYAVAAAGPAPATADAVVTANGLAKRVVVSGLCRGRGHYRLVLSNSGTGMDRHVDADLRVRGLAPRSRFGLGTQASTRFDDGTGVTGFGDGFANSKRDGVVEVRASTPAGLRHTFEFMLSSRNNTCNVQASA